MKKLVALSVLVTSIMTGCAPSIASVDDVTISVNNGTVIVSTLNEMYTNLDICELNYEFDDYMMLISFDKPVALFGGEQFISIVCKNGLNIEIPFTDNKFEVY